MEPRNGTRFISWAAVIGVLVVVIGFLAAQGISHVFNRLSILELVDKELRTETEMLRREREMILIAREREWALMKERVEKMQLRDDMQDRRLDALEGRRR